MDIDPTRHRGHGRGTQSQVLILDSQLGRQRGTQEQLDGSLAVFKSSEGLHEFSFFNVVADAIGGLEEEPWNRRLGVLGILEFDGQGLEEVAVLDPLAPASHGGVPNRLLEREDEVDVGGFGDQGCIGVDLEEKLQPVLFGLARQLDFKDLRLCLAVRMPLHVLVAHHGVIGHGALDDAVQETLGRSQKGQEGLGGLGLGQGGLIGFRERREPDLYSDEQGVQVDGLESEEFLGHTSQKGIGLFLGEDLEESPRVSPRFKRGDNHLGQQFLQGLAAFPIHGL